MKHLILAAAFLTATFIPAFAGERPTKAENDAAMRNGRTELSAKVVELENNIKNHNAQQTQAVAAEVLVLMQKGMAQTRIEVDLEKGAQQKAANARFLKLEEATHQYRQLSGNVAVNGKQLVEYAQSFVKQY